MGLLFWHCVHGQWTRFDRLTRQVINISTAISQSLSCTTKNADEDYKLAVETSQRFRGGGTEIQLGGGGQHGRVRGCKAADYLHDVSACEGQELGG